METDLRKRALLACSAAHARRYADRADRKTAAAIGSEVEELMNSTGSETSIRALGEVVLRVRDLRAMTAFYESVLGLPVIDRSERMVFFRIAPGFAGHTQVLALFDQSIPPNHPEGRHDGLNGLQSPLHHLAFAISVEDYDRERVHLEGLGLTVRLDEHAWVKWRSLYIRDPEGNVVELVCYDQDVS